MTLPALTLPKIDLPFDIPVLMHPPLDHFAIALPMVVLLLEFYNLFAKRKSIGAFSFGLLIVTIVVFGATYLTGGVDGKEAYDLLSLEGQEALKSHKLLGTYLLLGTVVVLFFKFLAMTGKKVLKFLFFVVLIGLIVVTFEQGQHGGELVYKYGANVERVKDLDDELFDAKEALEEAEENTAKVDTPSSGATENQTSKYDSISSDTKKKETAQKLIDSVNSEIEKTNEKVLKVLENAAEKKEEIPEKVEYSN